MSETRDIGVLGSGPAALTIGAALARRNASVTLLAPEPHRRWSPNYCLWANEVPESAASALAYTWDEVRVATKSGERRLPRRYARLDGDAFQARQWDTLLSTSVRTVAKPVSRVLHRDGHSELHTEDGSVERVRVVVDASGANTPFVRRVHSGKPAHQMAYGLWLDAPGHGFDPGCAVLMDFRPADAGANEPPSFLYVLPTSERRVFLEETSLAHRPAVSLDLLRSRLELRLRSLGLAEARRVREERCLIPMGLALPARGQPLVPFGAAASMVHPASGYSLAHTFRKAEPVAAALIDELASGDPDTAIAAANAALWPRADRSAWELYTFGLETLLDLDADETAAFFERFFELGADDWTGYLSGTLPRQQLGAVMTRLFRSLPKPVQWQLIRTTVSSGAAPLARTFLQSRTP